MICSVSINYYNFNSSYNKDNRKKLVGFLDSQSIPHSIAVEWDYADKEQDDKNKESLKMFLAGRFEFDVTELARFSFPFEVIGVSESGNNFIPQVSNQLSKILSMVEKRGMKVSETKVENMHIHLPEHTSYIGVDQVKVLEDCCTDSLQRRLEEGWRILAICPQPHQRRPDYILGMYNG